MLSHLLIKNYALIQHLAIEPANALNIVTGETGAGKSIMLGALGLLIGKRADTKVLYDPKQKCIVEGTFDIQEYQLQAFFEQHELDYSEQTFLRREISPAGKSRAFINDTPVTLEVIRQLGAILIDIHSQHDTLQLGANAYQLELLDAFAGNQELKSAYELTYRAFRKKESVYKKLKSNAAQIRQEADYHQFLFNELEEMQLEEGEQSQLEEQVQLIDNAEEIKTKLNGLLEMLSRGEGNVEDRLSTASNWLGQLAGISPAFEALKDRLESCFIELRDIQGELETEEEKVDFNPQEAEIARERLSEIFRLQKKHGLDSLEELMALHEELRQKVSTVENLDEELEMAQQAMMVAEEEMLSSAAKLSQSRLEIVDQFTEEITALVRELGMENASMRIEQETVAPSPTGTDEVNLLFSANKGMPHQSLKSVASGGEFSRLMFAVKFVMADKMALPTIIFDEIDTGISGEVALKMVKMMEQMAQGHQLLVITHLPQIASKGSKHYFVFKDHSAEKTVSRMKELSNEERISEIAKMIGGDQPSASALESAKELLK
ncbi:MULTISPECIES: DNA repair protein RecN [Persicobacter]|uniref:DNA repair protein RecN n=1 Tax=Persicobacter diffluens TaxID=981 RepID=A0AAN4W0D8_9BACT|nr:DNA repair protein RecN [Persicobacter sp. CCB-QB2]GJM62416.1 DNA repair protein RecN [Persicobacter diffluens]